MGQQIDAAGRAGGRGGESVQRFVGQLLNPRAEGLDTVPQKRLLDQTPQPAMIGRIAEQHVRRQRPQRPRQPRHEPGHPPVARRDRALHEPMMIAQQFVHRFIRGRHPGLAQDRQPRANQRPSLAHPGQRGERILLELAADEVKRQQRSVPSDSSLRATQCS